MRYAALDLASGTVIGSPHARHRAIEFRKSLQTIEHEVPAHLEVHLIIDNASTHKTPAITRWLLAHPRVVLHFTPTSASWLNLVERWFSELTSQSLRRSTHRSVRALNADIRAWIEGWNENPRPYVWTNTADQILESIARYRTRITESGHRPPSVTTASSGVDQSRPEGIPHPETTCGSGGDSNQLAGVMSRRPTRRRASMDGSGRRRRAIIWAILAPVAALVASGCAALTFTGATQQDTVGKVRVTVGICASKGTPACPNGNSGLPGLTTSGQILLGLQVPAATVAPASFISSGPEALTFSDSPTYAAELQRLDPAVAGQKWVGYLSATAAYSETSGPQSIIMAPEFDLMRGADGSPFPTPFAFRVVAGGRVVQAASPSTRPVSCGTSLTTPSDAGICVDSSLPLAAASTRDLGILTGAGATARANSLATVPFVARYAGAAAPGADFALTASTTLPGGRAAVGVASLAPAASGDTRVPVAVGVPRNALPGSYDVSLTARLANGQTRSATGRLTVAGGPVSVAVNTSRRARMRLRTILPAGLAIASARARGLPVLIGSTRRRVAVIRVYQGRGRVAKATARVRLKVPGPTRVVLRSALLTPGPYRLRVRVGDRRFVWRGVLLP